MGDEEFILKKEELASKLKLKNRRRSPIIIVMKSLLSAEAAQVLDELNVK